MVVRSEGRFTFTEVTLYSAWICPVPRMTQIDTDYHPHCNICGNLWNLWEYHVPRIAQIDTDYIIHRNICGICEICVRNHVPRIAQTDTDYYPSQYLRHLRNQREKSCPTDSTDWHGLYHPLQYLRHLRERIFKGFILIFVSLWKIICENLWDLWDTHNQIID